MLFTTAYFELIPRYQQDFIYPVLLWVLTLVILVTAKLVHGNYFYISALNPFGLISENNNLKMKGIVYLLLFLNYFVLLPSMIFIASGSADKDFLLLCFSLTTFFILWPFILFALTFLVLGKNNLMILAIKLNLNFIVTKSLLASILFTYIIFFPNYRFISVASFLTLLFLFYIVRFFILLFNTAVNHVKWYYLILYLCTLEILPFLSILLIVKRVVL